jgi:predicted transposase/invertase (TIGR01784 family)
MEQKRRVIVTEEDIAKAWQMSRQKYELDESHKHSVWIMQGRSEGLKEGRKEGASQRDYEIARSLLSDGLSIERVAKHTGLALDTIQGLNANL